MTVRTRQRPDSLNERIGTAAKLTAKPKSEFPERNGHAPCQRRKSYFPGGFAAGAGPGAGDGAPAFVWAPAVGLA
jgi:hypothetical protein